MGVEDSGGVRGGDLVFAAAGAGVEVLDVSVDDALIAAWRTRIDRAAKRLGWSNCQAIVRRHASGASLAIAAPSDQLFLAPEVNKSALCAAFVERDPVRWSGPAAALVSQLLLAHCNTSYHGRVAPP